MQRLATTRGADSGLEFNHKIFYLQMQGLKEKSSQSVIRLLEYERKGRGRISS